MSTYLTESGCSAQIPDLGESVAAAIHPGVSCKHCDLQPIRGPRLKCRVCDDFNLYQQCLNSTSSGHPHPFSRITCPGEAAVYAGRPGRKLLQAPPVRDTQQTATRSHEGDVHTDCVKCPQRKPKGDEGGKKSEDRWRKFAARP